MKTQLSMNDLGLDQRPRSIPNNDGTGSTSKAKFQHKYPKKLVSQQWYINLLTNTPCDPSNRQHPLPCAHLISEFHGTSHLDVRIAFPHDDKHIIVLYLRGLPKPLMFIPPVPPVHPTYTSRAGNILSH